MQLLAEYPTYLNSPTQGGTNSLYLIEKCDIGTYLPNLIAYKCHLRITKDHVGKYVEITRYKDSYEDSRIFSRELAENTILNQGM